MRAAAWVVLAAVAVTLVAACGAETEGARPASPEGPGSAPATGPDRGTAAAGGVAALEGTLESIYRKVNPSVVNVRVVAGSEGGGLFGGAPTQGVGSGFVWDRQGHVVTNNHVVEGARDVQVTFSDGTSARAEVVGTDPDSDLAVLRVDRPADRLRPVEVGDSTEVGVGQLAAAIGNPFGLEGSMSVGFVSALGRVLPSGAEAPGGGVFSIPDVIQTDASLNPGNSGGVLVDSEGRLIGVPSAIISPTRVSAGIGFSVPSAIVEKVVPELIRTGTYEQPWIGIAVVTLGPDRADAMGLDAGQRGAMVIEVVGDSPADAAGLKGSAQSTRVGGRELRIGGDVIVAIDEEPVEGSDGLITYLARYTEVGQTVTLAILREGERVEVPVTLAARPSDAG